MEAGLAGRSYPVGAEFIGEKAVSFRVWAPKRSRVHLVVDRPDGSRTDTELARESSGYHSGVVLDAHAGMMYRYRLDGEDALYPDPASRFQPAGPHGSSQIVDSRAFAWTDQGWPGVPEHGKVIYEMHAGTFTREGTWRAATDRLDHLADLGINIVEVMPVAEFPGAFGWGYDGVDLFAPFHGYGTPDDLRFFIDSAHTRGIGVILDVVYNHFGPDGCYWRAFSDTYFSERYRNEWGDPINFEGAEGEPVREFFLANARYWIEEFHFDGLRLDATQQIFDGSEEHIVAAIVREARKAGAGRRTYVVCENEPQDPKLVRSGEQGGWGADAIWNDDFHHTARVALTGRNEAYYSDYTGSAQELTSAIKWGFLFQGQRYSWQKKRRGSQAFDIDPRAFVSYLQNHDQVANSAAGERLQNLASPARLRAITALLLLGPHTPMLFQGQEFGASQPFLYFADHQPDLADAVARGRAEFLGQFPSIGKSPEVMAALAAPAAGETFARCKLDWAERERNAAIYALHRDLLSLRRSDPVFSRPEQYTLHTAVLGPHAFALRLFAADGEQRLVLVNLGVTLRLHVAPEPLLAPPTSAGWALLWSSEALRYGGGSTPAPEDEDGWIIQGEASVVLCPAD